MRLKGKAAVITGAGSGIGRAASLRFAREGAAVVCVDIDAEFGEETARLIRKEKGQAEFFQADVGDAAQVRTMARRAMRLHERVHVLFNNAAILARDDLETLELDAWNRHLAVNLTGPLWCSRELLPALKAAGGASIIHGGSIDGAFGAASIISYSVSKGGLMPLTRVMAHAWAKYRIRVNCLNLGAVRTSSEGIPIRFTEELRRGLPMNPGLLNATPLARPGAVEEAAAAALFLASEDSSYFTGSVLTMDGGRTAITPGVPGSG